VNCTGRVDPIHILRALEVGADGVLISGCHIGDCHYTDGNVKAVKRFKFFKKILDEMGIGNRVNFEHVSGAEAAKWADVITNMVERIRELGPSPLRDAPELTDLHLDELHSKKERIHALLTAIANRMNYEITEPLPFDAEEVSEGFGFPKRDAEKCIGCYGCYSVCPEQAISMEDVDAKRKYGTMHASCLVCRECERACPQEAIEIVPSFELMSFLKNEPLWDFDIELQQCSICNDYFMPVPFTKELKERLIEKGEEERVTSLGLPFDPYNTCPDCKRHRLAQAIAEVSNPAMFKKKGGS
jgi:coenzyme F420-reducing hydrogenase delta subunit/formate hydrogenlyase subunit 6/NADH:ubiquinone oxidoreductase subunit I